MSRIPVTLVAAALTLATAPVLSQNSPQKPPQAQTRVEPMPGDFVVSDGRVDRGTYNGWRLFHTSCHGCHGVGGVGTGVAPGLVDKIGNYTPRGFATKVLTSYRIARLGPEDAPPDRDAEREALVEEVMKRERSARGQPLMPAWDDDDAVPPHVLDLYAYLNARAEGGLGPGKPGLLPRREPRPRGRLSAAPRGRGRARPR